MSANTIKIILEKGAKMPKKQTEGSAGHDLHAHLSEPLTIKPNELMLVSTGVRIGLPNNMEAQVRPRSSMTKIKIDVRLGTIDSDYTGVIKVFIRNNSEKDFVIEDGMRIAQLVFNHVPAVKMEIVDTLQLTERGEKGFGSTGIF